MSSVGVVLKLFLEASQYIYEKNQGMICLQIIDQFEHESDVTTLFSSIISSLRPDFDPEELNVPEITHIQLSPKISTNHVTRSRQRLRDLSLNQQFPCRVPGYELQIQDQPEEQHRARYLTEGSRGAVKNKAGDGHAVVKVHNS